MRTKKALSENTIPLLVTKTGETSVGGVPGLMLRVVAARSGLRAQWILRYRGNKTAHHKNIGLGTYPEVSLPEARRRAAIARRQFLAGKETTVTEADGMLSVPDSRATVREQLNEWFAYLDASGNWKTPRNRQQDTSRLANHIVPRLGELPCSAVTVDDVAEALRHCWGTETARKLQGQLFRFFTWLQVNRKMRDPAQPNPADLKLLRTSPRVPLGKKAAPRRNNPALPMERIPDFFLALTKESGVVALALEFTILTALRPDVTLQIHDEWVSGNPGDMRLVIPSEYMKVSANGALIVMLPAQAESLVAYARSHCLREIRGARILFPGERGQAVMRTNSFGNLIRRMNRAQEVQGLPPWTDELQSAIFGKPLAATAHGIARGSFATWCIAQKKDPRARELCLHHVVSKYRGAYDRDLYLKEKKKLLQEWADYCYSKCDRPIPFI